MRISSRILSCDSYQQVDGQQVDGNSTCLSTDDSSRELTMSSRSSRALKSVNRVAHRVLDAYA